MNYPVNNSTNSSASTSKNNNYLDKSVAQQKVINILQGAAKKKADSNNIEDNIRKQELKAELKHTQQKVQEIKDPLLKQNVARVQEGEVKSQYTYIPQVQEKSANLSTEAEQHLASKMESLVLNDSLTSKMKNLALNNYSMMSEEKIVAENLNFSPSSLKNEGITNPVLAKFIKLQVSLSDMSAKLMNTANKTKTTTDLSYQKVATNFMNGQDDLINKSYESSMMSANQTKNAAFAGLGAVATQVGLGVASMGSKIGANQPNDVDLGVKPFEKIANATNEKLGGLMLHAADEKVDDNLLSLLAPNTALEQGKLASNFQPDAIDKLVNTVEPVLHGMEQDPTTSLIDESGGLFKEPKVSPSRQMQDVVAEELLNTAVLKGTNEEKIKELDKVATDFSERSAEYANLSKKPVILATGSSIVDPTVPANAAHPNRSSISTGIDNEYVVNAQTALAAEQAHHLAALAPDTPPETLAAAQASLEAAQANPNLSLPRKNMQPATAQKIQEILREKGISAGSTIGLKVSAANKYQGVISVIIEDTATATPPPPYIHPNPDLGTFRVLSVPVRRVKGGKWEATPMSEISIEAEIKLSGDELTRMRKQNAIDFATKSSLVSVLLKSPAGVNNGLRKEDIKTYFLNSIAGKDNFKNAVKFTKDYAFARKLNEKTGIGEKYVKGASKTPAQRYADLVKSRSSRDDMQQNKWHRSSANYGHAMQAAGASANVVSQNYAAMAEQSRAIAGQQSSWQNKQNTTLGAKNQEASSAGQALSQAEQAMLQQLTQTNNDVANALASSTTK